MPSKPRHASLSSDPGSSSAKSQDESVSGSSGDDKKQKRRKSGSGDEEKKKKVAVATKKPGRRNSGGDNNNHPQRRNSGGSEKKPAASKKRRNSGDGEKPPKKKPPPQRKASLSSGAPSVESSSESKEAGSKKKRNSSSGGGDNNTKKKSSSTKPAPAKRGPTKQTTAEVPVQKSPAEFFAEHQAIAGFDNAGKSLFTSLRELVENGLDAAESIQALPEIDIQLTELTQAEFNAHRGDSPLKPVHPELYNKGGAGGGGGGRKSTAAAATAAATAAKEGEKESGENKEKDKPEDKKKPPPPQRKKKAPQEAYFILAVKDNGCGMSHAAIPHLLGRVLSGSKYGVRQTRGKFGLGAKMALIWAKKSTGMPIQVTTSHRPAGGGAPAATVSYCKLDIDIYQNEPKVLEHTKRPNPGVAVLKPKKRRKVNNDESDSDGDKDESTKEDKNDDDEKDSTKHNDNDSTKGDEQQPWLGTRMEVLIAGNWTAYRHRILTYLQQLAIITPYAQLTFAYHNQSDPKRDMSVRYERRSEQMPPPSQPVKHHPASVNNLVIQQLLQQQGNKKPKTLARFLSSELAAVSVPMGKKLVAEMGLPDDATTEALTEKKITRLVQVLQAVPFKNPDGACLAPLGEYNLNLGIRKVLQPTFVATARDKAGAHEGHPFVVEAAVSLGGRIKEGLTVLRFANRIPLLFEGGADVATRVAQKLNWALYKIDVKRDRIGVFVSLVSTKIPFKGTSKEYIGDDATAISQSVKRALQACCQQLRVHLTKRNALKDAKERQAKLRKYIPDVGRSLMGLLEGMKKRKAEQAQDEEEDMAAASSPTKRLRLDASQADAMIQQLDRGHVSEDRIAAALRETIEEQRDAIEDGEKKSSNHNKKKHAVAAALVRKPLYLVPVYHIDKDNTRDTVQPLFTFRPLVPVRKVTSVSSSTAR